MHPAQRDVAALLRLDQALYRDYWKLDAASLSDDYVKAYFKLLQDCRNRKGAGVTVEQIARELYEYPTHNKKPRSLQFSFATKLVHTLRPQSPVYDETVQTFFFLPHRPQSGSIDERLERLSKSYCFIVDEYQRVLRERFLSPSIATFRNNYNCDSNFTDEKIVDTLIWQFVKFFRNRDLQGSALAYY